MLTLQIEDTRTGLVENRTLGDWLEHVSAGVSIGSAEDCTVRLVAQGIASHHARYYGLSNHRFLDVLDEDAEVHFLTQSVRRGVSKRVDYLPFTIGPYTLRFGEK
ncbi:hypothetical protein BON30_02940 [Cystobacter ferrugineus]|uniref:FHA domain-containing protein n=2 Tax=Cystobacter ferrugineus TaxID=83449 RepID=A0A1L9BJ02_9BACT|nr:hypothetical protein BON30_02940 [Cystobacter ferrugineus]